MIEQKLIASSNGRQTYAGTEPGTLLYRFLDEATVFDGVSRDSFQGKNRLRNLFSAACFNFLELNDIPTHFLKTVDDETTLAMELSMFPFVVVCRCAASGAYSKRANLPEGALLPLTLIEFSTKSRGRPIGGALNTIVNITDGEIKLIQSRAILAGLMLKKFLFSKGYVLAEMEFLFGRDDKNRIKIAGDISPDTCRLWTRASHEKIDRDRFRTDAGSDEESYRKAVEQIAGAV